MNIDPNCSFCSEEEENINHLLKLMIWQKLYGLILLLIALTHITLILTSWIV